jgi:DNA modification methylase
VICGF